MKKTYSILLGSLLTIACFSKASAQSGQVLVLNGTSQYATIPSAPNLELANGAGYTISAWVKTTGGASRIFSKRKGGGGTGYEIITSASRQLGLNLSTNSNGTIGGSFTNETLLSGGWQHVAMVVDFTVTGLQTTTKIFINGVQATNTPGTYTATSSHSIVNSFMLSIGAHFNEDNSTAGSFFNGQLDNIRFYNTAMDATALSLDKNTAAVDANTPNLVAAWDFEAQNVNGTTVIDVTGHGNNATLYNNPVLLDIGDNRMQVINTSIVQSKLPTSGGKLNQKIIAVKVTTTGSSQPLTLSQINFTGNGSSNLLRDVSTIKIYKAGNRFNTNNLFAQVTPANGALSANGSVILNEGDNYFYIAYDVNANAPEGALLDATCESVVINGTTSSLTNSAEAGARTIFLTTSTLKSPGDDGSVSYRIPGIITAADGSLVAIFDKRWNHSGDLAAKIDPIVMRSTDNGQTWSNPVTIANFGRSTGAGDAAIVLDKTNGNIIALASADQGFFASTNAAPAKILLMKSTDNGITWSAPRDITSQIYSPTLNPGWKGLFVASGAMHQLRNGDLIAAIAVRQEINGNIKITNHLIKSTDHGDTWTAYTNAAEIDGDEAKVVELNDGKILMSVRNPGTRRMNKTADGGLTWGSAYNQPDISDPNCNGDIIRYTSVLDGYNKNRLLHSIPFAGTRRNVSVLLSTDEANSWPTRKTIFEDASAYSALTILPDGTIGIFYENGDEDQAYHMNFVRFSLNWLTNGADNYTVAGTPIQERSAPSGGNLKLNGTTQYAVVNHHANLNMVAGNSYTITAWVKPNKAFNFNRIFSKRNGTASTDYGYEFYLFQSDNIALNLRTTNGSNLGGSGTSNASLPLNQWSHVAIVVNLATAGQAITKFYVNGNLVTQTTAANYVTGQVGAENAYDVFIGSINATNTSSRFSGALDDIRFYNNGLDDINIWADKNRATVNSSTAGLVAAWDFEEANITGDVVADIAGNGHFATVMGDVALPLELISFNAAFNKTDKNVILNWNTANEINVNRFEILSSLDGLNFTPQLTLSSKGNDKQGLNSYNAKFLINNNAANNVYVKLKMIDNDGAFKYSDVKVIKVTADLSFTISPNPVNDLLNVVFPQAINGILTITDASGKTVKKVNATSNQTQIDVSTLPAGIYVLKVTTQKETFVSKWIKK